MRVLLLNSFNEKEGLYEVIDYDNDSATSVSVHVVEADDLVKLSGNGMPRDFSVSNRSYLYGSTSVERNRVLFSQPTKLNMELGYSVYNFLADLVSARGAYFLRLQEGSEKIQYTNGDYITEGYASVSSLRVSSSSMYVGVSCVLNGKWTSLALINSLPLEFSKEDGATVVHGRYRIAVELENVESLALCRKYCSEQSCKVIIDSKECQLFSEPKLPVYCLPTPVEFYPLSLLHYLNFWKVSLHHFKALVKDGLAKSSNQSQFPTERKSETLKRISVSVSSNEDKFSAERRRVLMEELSHVRFDGASLDDINMSSTERIAARMLLCELARASEEALPDMYRMSNELELSYSLSLMRLRTGMLYFPFCFEPTSGGRHLCYNGNGNMSGFATYLDIVNDNGRKVWSIAENKLVPAKE